MGFEKQIFWKISNMFFSLNDKKFRKWVLSRLITCRSPLNRSPFHPLISGQIRFLVQKDAQCSETYEKTIFLIIFLRKWLILYTNYQKIRTDFSRKKLGLENFRTKFLLVKILALTSWLGGFNLKGYGAWGQSLQWGPQPPHE